MANAWPALMLRETAAAYCDMTPTQFDRQCPVGAVDQGWRGHRWKRTQLDAWIEALPTRMRRAPLDRPPLSPANEGGPPSTPEARRAASLARLK